MDHLAAVGPSSIDDLRTELGLKRQELRSLRAPLERCGAIISRSLQVTADEGHQHSSELARWDQAHPGTSGADADPSRALKYLLAAAVRASVVTPELELRRWFSWRWYWTDTLVDDLIREGRLRRVNGHVMAVGQTRQTEGRSGRSHPGTPAEATAREFQRRPRTAVRRGHRARRGQR